MENIIEAPLKTSEIDDANINTVLETLESDCKMYRAKRYDVHDTEYALKLSDYFNSYLDSNLQSDFNEFTDNLMDDKQINRFSLLDAIEDFQKSEKYINTYKNNMNNTYWFTFTDMAFNYRPYQPCCIM
jgi:5'-deoxynucleotidase YfbR-like HD superfamily hydrolase